MHTNPAPGPQRRAAAGPQQPTARPRRARARRGAASSGRAQTGEQRLGKRVTRNEQDVTAHSEHQGDCDDSPLRTESEKRDARLRTRFARTTAASRGRQATACPVFSDEAYSHSARTCPRGEPWRASRRHRQRIRRRVQGRRRPAPVRAARDWAHRSDVCACGSGGGDAQSRWHGSATAANGRHGRGGECRPGPPAAHPSARARRGPPRARTRALTCITRHGVARHARARVGACKPGGRRAGPPVEATPSPGAAPCACSFVRAASATLSRDDIDVGD